MEGPYAFLSYSHHDRDVADKVRYLLEVNGVPCWIDHAQMAAGEHLAPRVRRAIQHASFMIPVVSEHAMRSRWMYDEFWEWQRAESTKPNRLMPVVVIEGPHQDPQQVLRASWYEVLEERLWVPVERAAPSLSELGRLVRAIQHHWRSEIKDPVGMANEAEPEAANRRMMWEAFRDVFQVLELDYRDAFSDPAVDAMVVVGLGAGGKTNALRWLQAHSPDATRIDLSRRDPPLAQRVRDVVVETMMIDGVSDVHDLITVLDSCETCDDDRARPFLVVACRPSLVREVRHQLRAHGLRYQEHHLEGLDLRRTLNVMRGFAKDELFQHRVSGLHRDATGRTGDGPSTPYDADEAFDVALRVIERFWVPVDPERNPGLIDRPQPFARRFPPTDRRPTERDEMPWSKLQRLGFTVSMYEVERWVREVHRKPRFRAATGLPELFPWQERYVERAFHQSLDPGQRALVRNVVRFGKGWSPEGQQLETARMLTGCRVLQSIGTGFAVADRTLYQYLVPPVVVHHLSDLHVSLDANEVPPILEAYLREIVRDSQSCPDLLVISGDLFGRSPETGEATRVPSALVEWFDKVRGVLVERRHPYVDIGAVQRILVVGGNHEVGSTGPPRALELPCRRAARRRELLASFCRQIRASHPYDDERCPDGSRSFHREVRIGPLVIALLDSCCFGIEGEPRPPVWRLLDAIGAGTIDVSGMPASLVEWVEEHVVRRGAQELEPGYVSQGTLAQLHETLTERPRHAEEVRLAVLHHPLTVTPFDRNVGTPHLANAGQVREVLTANHVSLALHGHCHQAWFEELATPLRSSWMLRSAGAAATGGSHDDDSYGFNEIRIRWEGLRPRILVRPVRRQGTGWWAEGGCEFEPGLRSTSEKIDGARAALQ